MRDRVQRRWGRLINTLNTLSKAAIAGSAPTALTRAAQRALSKVLSKEGSPHNVRVNALRVALSDPVNRLQARASGGPPLDTRTRKHSAGAQVTLGRIGEAPGLANVACILASDAASHVTGTAINVDAGLCPLI